MSEREVHVRVGEEEPVAATVAIGSVPPVMDATGVGLDQELIEGCAVMLIGLKSAPELNGRQGKLSNYDSVAGRWEVALKSSVLNSPLQDMQMELSNSRTVKVKAANLRRYDSLTAANAEAQGFDANHDKDVLRLTPSQRTEVDAAQRRLVEDMLGLYQEPPRTPACMKDDTCRMIQEPQAGIVSSKVAKGEAEVFRVPLAKGSGVEGYLYCCFSRGEDRQTTVTCSFRASAEGDKGIQAFTQQAPG